MSARNTLVTDTSVAYAAFDRSDADHVPCRDLLAIGHHVTLPAPVVVELDWIGRSRGLPQTSAAMIQSILDDSMLLYDLDWEDWARVRDLMIRYADLPLDLVDAAVVATAERLEEPVIATLDHRHFSAVRPRHVESFTLLPA